MVSASMCTTTRLRDPSKRTALREPVAMARSRASENNSTTSRAALCTAAESNEREARLRLAARQTPTTAMSTTCSTSVDPER